ncbi:DUF3124 domain-containing protein [Desulfoferula mesophila]|uniref:DUF3124 domain-containing protein n=1 Tax=Desulfoferula mesophila TaxID=3058419 RepID=A0AAU9EZ96_9BACT|nr:hypothetical protein FAK_39060 [Desulfoferula mesophilus]
MPMHRRAWTAAFCLLLLIGAVPAWAQPARQGAIYAPLYQEAIVDHRGRRMDLTATVYVRNISRKQAITVDSVTLVDGKGKMGTQCVQGKQRLEPLASLRLLPPACPAGTGTPSILIRWSAAQPAPAPLVEVLMMGTAGQQGISLTTQGVPLEPEP